VTRRGSGIVAATMPGEAGDAGHGDHVVHSPGFTSEYLSGAVMNMADVAKPVPNATTAVTRNGTALSSTTALCRALSGVPASRAG
jgi:hypothetical protein